MTLCFHLSETIESSEVSTTVFFLKEFGRSFLNLSMVSSWDDAEGFRWASPSSIETESSTKAKRAGGRIQTNGAKPRPTANQNKEEDAHENRGAAHSAKKTHNGHCCEHLTKLPAGWGRMNHKTALNQT